MTPMPGQSWLAGAASFVGMWTVMMAAMMLPSLAPALGRYRRAAAGAGAERPLRLTALVSAGYLLVWSALGAVVFALGLAAAGAVAPTGRPWPERAVPIVAAAVVSIAGALQFTAWKARRVAHFRKAAMPVYGGVPRAGSAFRHGLRLGLHCCASGLNLMAITLVMGIMDVRVMAVVTAAITVERAVPAGGRAGRAIGAVVVGAGLVSLARAVGLW